MPNPSRELGGEKNEAQIKFIFIKSHIADIFSTVTPYADKDFKISFPTITVISNGMDLLLQDFSHSGKRSLTLNPHLNKVCERIKHVSVSSSRITKG